MKATRASRILEDHPTDVRIPGFPIPYRVASIAMDDGSRIFLQMTDRTVDEIELDMPIELTFRKIHDGGSFHNYFWKTRPVR